MPYGWFRPLLVVVTMWFSACHRNASIDPARPLQPQLFSSASLVNLRRSHDVLDPGPFVRERGAAYGMSSSSCERFYVRVRDDHRTYQRIRKPWTNADELRFRQLIDLVTSEMGANPRLFRTWSLRESTHRPSAIHVLDPDLEAAAVAWHEHTYSSERERVLLEMLAAADASSRPYWEAKAELSRITTFRDNPFFRDVVEFELRLPDGTQARDVASIWAFGYGPFGFNPTFFLPIWDPVSPPWIFCGDDGVVAIVTAVWAARLQQRECEEKGVGDSYTVVNRRFSRGHCSRVEADPNFRRRASRAGLDPDARARLGRKWPQESTDRSELLTHLRTLARQQGLLSAK